MGACRRGDTERPPGETQEKPAGQTGSSGNPGGDHAVLFWQYYVENSKAVCCDAIRRNGGPVLVLLDMRTLVVSEDLILSTRKLKNPSKFCRIPGQLSFKIVPSLATTTCLCDCHVRP